MLYFQTLQRWHLHVVSLWNLGTFKECAIWNLAPFKQFEILPLLKSVQFCSNLLLILLKLLVVRTYARSFLGSHFDILPCFQIFSLFSDICPVSKYFALFPIILPYFQIFCPISKYFALFPDILPYFQIFCPISIYFALFPQAQAQIYCGFF